jgi:hypothetical protein
MNIDLLKESLLESIYKELIMIGYDYIRKPELSILYIIEELGNILYDYYNFQRFYFIIIHKSIHYNEYIIEIL